MIDTIYGPIGFDLYNWTCVFSRYILQDLCIAISGYILQAKAEAKNIMAWNALHDSKVQRSRKDHIEWHNRNCVPWRNLGQHNWNCVRWRNLGHVKTLREWKNHSPKCIGGEGFNAKFLAKEKLPIYLDIKLILQTLTPTKLPTTRNLLNKNLLSILPAIKNSMLFINNEILCWLLKEMTGIRAQKAE